MKTRWKMALAAVIFLAVIAGTALVTMRVQPENALAAYKKTLRDRGEKLAIAELLPPPVPPESNSVNAVEDAFRRFGSGNEKIPEAMKMVAPGKAMIGGRQPEARGYDFTNSWDDFAAEERAGQPVLELLHQVLERPRLDFQLDYQKGAALPLPHLSFLKRSAQKLAAAAVCDLHLGDTGAAATNLLTLLELAQRNAAEGLLISHLVRIAMTSIAIAPTWELLQATNVTDDQLAVVQQSWARMDCFSDAVNAFTVERAFMVVEIEKARASHENFERAFGLSSLGGSAGSGGWSWPPDWEEITERTRYAVGEVMWRSSWTYADELMLLRQNQILLETLRTMQTNRSQFYKADYDAMTARLSSLGITHAGEAFFRALKIPDFRELFGYLGWAGSAVRKTLVIETARRIVVTAVALKRFQLQRGKLPGTLAELVPAFLPSVPIDPYAGLPLRYQPKPEGTYGLYSVGDNGVDDGGDPTNAASSTGSGSASLYWQNPRARDWVWPQPATPEEVKLFNEHPPK